MKISKLVSILAIAVAALTVVPVASAQRGRAHVGFAGPRVIVAPLAPPPPPPAVVVPPAPFPGAVWTDGYYDYNGGRHVWVEGRYRRGRAGMHWRGHSWGQRDDGWVLTPGGWERD